MSLLQTNKNHIWHPFTQQKNSADPIVITRGTGASLFDDQGKEYLDLISSWWVNLHGHGHPDIVAALQKQAETLEHVMFAGFTHEPAILFAKELTNLLPKPFQRIFYSDNGSTAIEVAVKMALQYWYNKGINKKRLIAFEGAYHGDTFGAMSLGKSSGFYGPFSDYLFDVDFLDYPQTWFNDHYIAEKEAKSLDQLDQLITQYGEEIAALVVEPLVQGVGGMRMCRPEFLEAVLLRCRFNNILVIYDEIMTGFGRTGTVFACQQQKEVPDFICLSKGITGGFLPLAVTVTHERIYEGFLSDTFDKTFTHGHSYTANPLGCAAALASLALLTQDQTLEKIKIIQNLHEERISQLETTGLGQHSRVCGTIAAIDFPLINRQYGNSLSHLLKQRFLEAGLNIRPLGNVIYLMPPYCITPAQLHDAYDLIEKILKSFCTDL